MNILLRLKNWQIFLAMTIFPLIIAIGIFKLFDLGNQELDYIMSFVALVYYTVFMGWNYSVIKYFNKPEKIMKKSYLNVINWLLIIVVLYGVFLAIPFHLRTNSDIVSKFSVLIMPLFGFTFFYLTYGTAKTLKTIQYKENIRTSDIAVEMFLIFYLPIGIWWLQKRVNTLYKEKCTCH